MLVGALDYSFDTKQNLSYMGIVLGTEENISSMIKKMNLDKLSKSSIKYIETRKKLASMIQFNQRESIGFCIKTNRDEIIQEIKNTIIKKKLRIPQSRIYYRHNQLLLNQVSDKMVKFISNNNDELRNINFECDSDCRSFIKDNGLKYKSDHHVHILSDLVAWSNNKGNEPDGVIFIDVTRHIPNRLRREFRKK